MSDYGQLHKIKDYCQREGISYDRAMEGTGQDMIKKKKRKEEILVKLIASWKWFLTWG